MNVTTNDIIRVTKNHAKIAYTHTCLDTEMEMENLLLPQLYNSL